MAPPSLTPMEQAGWDNDRRPALYATLSVLLVLNNVVTLGRLVGNYYTHYRNGRFKFHFRHIFIEDYFILLSAMLVDAVIANLFLSTKDGLGLHSWRINAEDPSYPKNLSNTFEHVWIVMVFTGPTFTFIKLTLLFFYRRLFLVNQKWLKVAWWANLIYVTLWLFGATGFYLFQCWPVQWYFMRYYSKYDVNPPYPIEGQCNATTTTHVSIPIIFGLVSDIAILLLPVVTISRLRISYRTKLGITAVFSIGVLACALDLARIIELLVDTDDKIDPSYGVVIFLILSVSTEVAGVTCACLPVIVPALLKAYKESRKSADHPEYGSFDGSSGVGSPSMRRSHRFTQLGDSHLVTTITTGPSKAGHGFDDQDTDRDNRQPTRIGLSDLVATPHCCDDGIDRQSNSENGQTTRIWIERQIKVDPVVHRVL